MIKDVRFINYNKFHREHRAASKQIVDHGFYTFFIPPASSGFFLERIRAVSPEIPVIAHPLIGRFHLACSDQMQVEKLRESSLALGGKLPVEWGYIVKKGIAGLFTKPELAIARALKRDMDPSGIFNPHMGIYD